MSGRKNAGILLALVCSVSLISASVTAMWAADYYNRTQFRLLGSVCENIILHRPESENTVLAVLKDLKNRPGETGGGDILEQFGYRQVDFLSISQKNRAMFAAAGFLCGCFMFLLAFRTRNKRETQRIEALTDYLERVNNGGSGLLLETQEDRFSKLQDEIYKTVTFAFETRDAALKAKENFAENLSNIAHQLKTPITAISLSAQMIKEGPAAIYANQIKGQINRLTHLEEALLLLSRLDAGTLPMELKTVDVFTVLTMAGDNLQEVFSKREVFLDIPDKGEAWMTADLEWTMEAVMNLLKNCMEHSPKGGTVHCSYEQNPLYTRIQIWDEGEGFAKEEIPCLFERFYRGRKEVKGGVGIGLSLAKAILERENGTITAKNLPDGGACFEIRIYSH